MSRASNDPGAPRWGLRSPPPSVALGAMVVFAALALSQTPFEAQTRSYAAEQLANSVGVNIHLHYDGTLYRDNFDLVKARMIDLGVRHFRDGLIDTTWQEYYDRHNALGSAGIKGAFIVTPASTLAVMQAYPTRMSASFEAYEAPNEYNQSGDPNWVATMRTTLTRMHELKNTPAVAGFPIIGPSLTHETAYTALGDVSGLIDIGNLHNYFAGRHPGTSGWGAGGYGSIAWNLNLARKTSGAKPIYTTETGYLDRTDMPDWAPLDIGGRYMPRLVLEHFRAGIARTYLYELADFTGSESYGLLGMDGTIKPAFRAVRGLLKLFADPGPAITAGTEPQVLTGLGQDARVMSFQKRGGRTLVALWIEQTGFDPPTSQYVVVPPRTATLTLPAGLTLTAIHRWQDDGNVAAESVTLGPGTHAIGFTDRLTVLDLQSTAIPKIPVNVRIVR